jgi:hypothetical protein
VVISFSLKSVEIQLNKQGTSGYNYNFSAYTLDIPSCPAVFQMENTGHHFPSGTECG